MNFFYILSGPLGYVMEWIYKLLPNYGWDIILFTLLINIVKIPLQTSQQKSMAKMSAFQPMIAEIQTKPPHPAAEQRVIVHQYNSAKFHRYSFSADSAWVLTRIFACIPTPLALVMSNRPFRELIREAMFDNPMPQSVTAAGLNPRPLSV